MISVKEGFSPDTIMYAAVVIHFEVCYKEIRQTGHLLCGHRPASQQASCGCGAVLTLDSRLKVRFEHFFRSIFFRRKYRSEGRSQPPQHE